MAYQQVPVELIRDGHVTPWGFRMTGGADIGAPLVIQKVCFGSPSDGELSKGDILLRIRDRDAAGLSHKAATELITKAGSTLKMVIARPFGYTPGGMFIPSTPVAPHLRPLLTPTPSDGSQHLFKPLPTTNFASHQQRRLSTESFNSTTSFESEKEAIVNQPYRSTPLILPSAKPSKDIPVGSYLRHENRRTSTPPNIGSRVGDAYNFSKVQEAIIEAAHSSSGFSSPGRTPTPDMALGSGLHNGPQVAMRQYNSPINMYSNQAIVEAIAAQTVNMRRAPIEFEMLDKKLSIKQSPTYQLIHDEEWKKGKVEEFEPLKEHVYNVLPGEGHYRPDIQQSASLKSIMHDLRPISEY